MEDGKTGKILTTFLTFMMVTMITNTTRADELAPHLFKTTMENGLTTLVKETPGTKVATVQLWVKAGSVYEGPDERGITHLIEHMIFKGTPKMGPGGVAAAIEDVGGRINAYTTYEYTVYHATLPASHWENALDALADAVQHSLFDPAELEREKKVVLEEIGMRKDRPIIMLYQELMATSYTTHPYRLPVIGTEESVSGFTRDDIVGYMQRLYNPENFTVVIVGDVQAGAVVDKVKDLMSGLPRGDYAQPPPPREPVQQAPRFFKVEDDVNQPQMALSFPISPFKSPDTPVFDVIASILGQGETSRLYNQLRNKRQLVYRIDASAFTPHDPGLLEVTAALDAKNIVPALEAALVEIFKLKYLPVSDEELKRAKLNLESDFIFNLERVEGQARVIGSFELLAGDPREEDYLRKLRAVSVDDIMRVASRHFKDRRLTAGILVSKDSTIDPQLADLDKIIARAEDTARHAPPASLVGNAYLSNVHRFSLENGIRLLVREDPQVPTVSFRVIFPGGLRGETEATNGAFAFISDLLPKGTQTLSARELALKVADMAGELNGFNGKNTFGLKGDFLSRFWEQGLRLVRDVVRTPAFVPEEAEKIRPELLAQLKEQEDSLASLAFREFNRLLFHGHPYGLNSLGSETVIRHISVADLKGIYHKFARPDRMVLSVAGDVQAKVVRDAVNKLFGDWENTANRPGVIEEDILPPDPPSHPEMFNIDRQKEQVHIIIGFLGATLTSSDRYGLEVLDSVLNAQSGRLFTELRDKRSLAYSLSSFSMLGLDTGAFGIYLGTSPDKKEEAIKGIWKELYRAQEELISEAELKKAQNVLISHYQLGLQSHGSQAMDMGLGEVYNLGLDFGNRYITEIKRVDAQKVRELAKKYIQPEHYVLITVGANSVNKAAETQAATGN